MNIKEAVRKWGPEYLAICGLAKYFPTMNSESSVFFVNGSTGNDSDGENGQRPETPLLTITKALSLCTANKNDYIFVLDYYQATGETWPISISKAQVHIIGITGKAVPWSWVQPTGDTAAFVFTTGSGYSELAGFELGAGASHGCIEVTTSGLWGLHIHDCSLGSKSGMTGKYGIYTPAGELIHGLVEKCKFGSGLSTNGVLVPSNAGPNSCDGLVIRNNLFNVNGSGDIAIQVDHTSADFNEGGILYNTFVTSDSTTGLAVSFASGAKGLVHGNVGVMDDGAAPANNPFSDAGTGIGWGINYQGGTALLAAPA